MRITQAPLLKRFQDPKTEITPFLKIGWRRYGQSEHDDNSSAYFSLTQSDFAEMGLPDSQGRFDSMLGRRRTCPGLTNRGQGRPAASPREKSQKLQEAQLRSRTLMGLMWRGETSSAQWKACCGTVRWTCAAARWIGPDTMSQAPGRHSKGLFQIWQAVLCHASSAWMMLLSALTFNY